MGVSHLWAQSQIPGLMSGLRRSSLLLANTPTWWDPYGRREINREGDHFICTVCHLPPWLEHHQIPGSSRQLRCRTQVFHQTSLSLRLLSAVFWGCGMPQATSTCEPRTGRSPGSQLLLTFAFGPGVPNLLIFLSPSPYFFLGLLMLHNQALFLNVKGRS